MEARRSTSPLEDLGKPQWKGAEAFLYLADWAGVKVVVKKRVAKAYRHPELDEKIRRSRVLAEARAILAALKARIPAPTVYYVDPATSTIVLEYIDGKPLYEHIEESSEEGSEGLDTVVAKLGYYVGKLHEIGIAHGDLTTSNVIVAGNEPVIIDYGLAEKTRVEEDKAVDIHLFLRSLESAHPDHVDDVYKWFLQGYERARGPEKTERILRAVERIRLMGRYVEARRKHRMVWEER